MVAADIAPEHISSYHASRALMEVVDADSEHATLWGGRSPSSPRPSRCCARTSLSQVSLGLAGRSP